MAEEAQLLKEQETKKKVDFEVVIKQAASQIAEDSKAIPEKTIRASYEISYLKAIAESAKIKNYRVDKVKGTVTVTFEPETVSQYLGSIYDVSAEEIEAFVFRNRKNVAYMLAYQKIARLHLRDENRLVEFLKN